MANEGILSILKVFKRQSEATSTNLQSSFFNFVNGCGAFDFGFGISDFRLNKPKEKG
jgi:hypothetical protein